MVEKHSKVYIISGRVQGVWYRKFTYDWAQKLNIKGYVMNLDDGRVFCHAEAEPGVLKMFEQALKQGSPLSKVENIEVRLESVHGFGIFEIR